MYSPSGEFLEIAKAIPVNQLPPVVLEYVKTYYKGSSISTNGKIETKMGVTFSDLNYITIQRDGKILAVGGAVTGLESTDSFVLARYSFVSTPW
jgi:hypothetical protein